jgi:hypothetical protein
MRRTLGSKQRCKEPLLGFPEILDVPLADLRISIQEIVHAFGLPKNDRQQCADYRTVLFQQGNYLRPIHGGNSIVPEVKKLCYFLS